MGNWKITGSVVNALVPYDTGTGAVDLQAFSRYIAFAVAEGAKAILVSADEGDLDLLSFEERIELAKAAVHTVRGEIPVLAAVTEAGNMSPLEQASALLETGIDGLTVRSSSAGGDTFEKEIEGIAALRPGIFVIDDHKTGGVDMNNMGRSAASSGISLDTLVDLKKRHEELKGVLLNIPVNECGPKCSAILSRTDGELSVLTCNAVDQALEMLDRGSEAMVTPVFIRVMNKLCELFKAGGVDRARPLFFDFLRVIVWTKQYKHRGPYLHRLYLKEKGILPEVTFRCERPIDRYMAAYGREMLDLALKTEAELDRY